MTQALQQLRVGLDQAGFEQRRQLVELLIDRVVVTDDQVEIRYATRPPSQHQDAVLSLARRLFRSRRGRGRRLGRR
jgi:hypothetical protein